MSDSPHGLERLKVAVWSYAIKHGKAASEIEFYYDTVRDTIMAVPGSTVEEFNELENTDTVVEGPPTEKQPDLFDKGCGLEDLWDIYIAKVRDESA